MYHPFNIPTLAPGVEYKLCQTWIPMSFLSLFSTQSIFIQFYGKCTHFVQLPECSFPMPLIYFKVCFFWIRVLLQQHFFHVLSCKYSLLILNPFGGDNGYVCGAKGQTHKLAEASHPGHNSWFSFLFQGLTLIMFTPPKDCIQGAGGRILCSDCAACIRAQRLLGRWWWPAEIPLFGPTWTIWRLPKSPAG